ncbi:MAG: YXWGXW repeat-containing protein [Candidatus Aminicenantia bacterium]
MKRIISLVCFFSILLLPLLMEISCATVIRTPPPSAKVEIRPPTPYPGAVWISGHWKYTRHGWVWVSGHWAKPPRRGAVWVPGRWVKTPHGWKWRKGHWR